MESASYIGMGIIQLLIAGAFGTVATMMPTPMWVFMLFLIAGTAISGAVHIYEGLYGE